jgi:hypothetical protein
MGEGDRTSLAPIVWTAARRPAIARPSTRTLPIRKANEERLRVRRVVVVGSRAAGARLARLLDRLRWALRPLLWLGLVESGWQWG